MPMIEFKNVSKWYGGFQVLKDCTTKVEKGEVVVVCGPSGSGKSTLIKCVNGLEPFQHGEIIVNGESVGATETNLPRLRSKIGMVFQHFELFPHMSVIDNLNLAQVKVLGRGAEEATAKSMALLKRVGIDTHARKFPGELSGGQQQRVAIARALVSAPSILLADEPTGNLDTESSREIMAVLETLNRVDGITVMLVTHEAEIAAYAARQIVMKDGQVVEDRRTDAVAAGKG